MVIIHTAGNSKIGIGNISRSIALWRYLKKIQINTILIIESNTTLFQKMFDKQYSDTHRCDNRIESKKKLRDINNTYKKSIYVSDLVDIDEDFGQYLKELEFKKRIHLNDQLQGGYIPEILVDEDPFSKNYPREIEAVYNGVQYRIFREDILEAKGKVLPPKAIKRILICFGGADPGGYTEAILEILTLYTNRYDITGILGLAMDSERREAIKKKFSKIIRIYENLADLTPYIVQADAVITLGGITAYEAVVLGRVSLAIEWDFMGKYTEEMDKAGIVSSFSSIQDFKNKIENSYLDDKQLLDRAYSAYLKIDGKGVNRVAQIIHNEDKC